MSIECRINPINFLPHLPLNPPIPNGCIIPWYPIQSGLNSINVLEISPKSIPNSEKQKQLPNTQWMKYVYCPALFYSRGRACKLQSRHKHCMKKTFFQKRLRYCGQHARSSCKGFSSQRTAVRLTLHFIYLTYIIHIFFVLCITYIFYTIF